MAQRMFKNIMKKFVHVPRIKVIHAGVFLDVAPKNYATQLTLMDLEVFKKIEYEELANLPYDKQSSPNVMAMVDRFNYVIYWTMREILKECRVKKRAKVVAHFIHIAEELSKLNNISSELAVISALLSPTISRLKQTWNLVPKKQKKSLDKMQKLLTWENNFEILRELMSSIELPCIPYLGLYQKDVIGIDAAHPLQEIDNDLRILKMKKVLSSISHLQKSNYDYVEVLPMIQFYLEPDSYTKETQKRLEDCYYMVQAEEFSSSTHVGTHMDAPAHFSKGGMTIEQLPVSHFMAPAAVVDISAKGKLDPDAEATVEDLQHWESVTGQTLNETILLLRTGWGRKWNNQTAYFGTPDNDTSKLHFPGLSGVAAQWLVDNRNIYGIGIDTLSFDKGSSQDVPAHRTLLGHGIFGLENVARMEELPIYGAKLYVMPMKIGSASGAPTRIIATYPEVIFDRELSTTHDY